MLPSPILRVRMSPACHSPGAHRTQYRSALPAFRPDLFTAASAPPVASGAGQGTVIASCTPPTCNAGIKPTLPIYPQAAFNFDVRSTSSTAASPTVYATTTACRLPTHRHLHAYAGFYNQAFGDLGFCRRHTDSVVVARRIPCVFDNSGSQRLLGGRFRDFSQQGLMIFNGSSVYRSDQQRQEKCWPFLPTGIRPSSPIQLIPRTCSSSAPIAVLLPGQLPPCRSAGPPPPHSRPTV